MLRQHMFSRFICSMKNNPFDFIYFLFYAGILATLAMVLVNPDEALKVFIFSTALSLPLIGKNIKHVCSNKQNLVLPVMLLLFGLLQVIWVEVFKQPGSAFTGAYRSYQNGGKVMIFAALVMTALASREPCANTTRIASIWTILTAIGLYLFAGYLLADQPDLLSYRLALGFEHQTGTAYALTMIGLLASQAIINLRMKHTVPLYLLHFLISLAVIITTQTRAAILVYPILSIGLFLMYYSHNRIMLFKALLGFVILVGLAAIPLKSVLENRYQNFMLDVHSYSQNNSNTSIGARLAMQQVGIETGKAHIWGQSLEQRSDEIQRLTVQHPSWQVALIFVNVHLHNEIVDTFSLKGIPGVVVLLLLYTAMFLIAYWQRSPLLFVVSGAIAVYGLSDLLLYAKGEALSSVLALCVAAVLSSNPTRERCHG
ncbi:O-antigen ligase family protein [Citrobacter portucalensis]|uniref:O-antigen ligase family protein n=1 Tax=Citrobacter portucalensis TaxID=1639133 RepID=UPI003BF57D12